MAATFYAQILHEWGWPEIAEACKTAFEEFLFQAGDLNNPTIALDEIDIEGPGASAALDHDAFPSRIVKASVYLGTWMNMCPSGRFYAPWSAVKHNVRERDGAYSEALDKVGDKFGLSIENGEGDPTDMFANMYFDLDQ